MYRTKGFTLVEMLSVVAVIALCAAAALPTFLSEQKYQAVGVAVERAGAIAAAIDMGRSLGRVSVYNGSLRGFIAAEGGDVGDYMSTINSDFKVLGADQRDLYQVRVTGYSVAVSFSQTGSEYSDFNYPSSEKAVATGDIVTWTVWPAYVDGIGSAHMANHYINNGD
ncbi:MAG: hypothetical protein CMK89_23730 [Pseudomonadales bacterium]|nr:hypothetical protein [Pseudomonadales bacterium]